MVSSTFLSLSKSTITTPSTTSPTPPWGQVQTGKLWNRWDIVWQEQWWGLWLVEHWDLQKCEHNAFANYWLCSYFKQVFFPYTWQLYIGPRKDVKCIVVQYFSKETLRWMLQTDYNKWHSTHTHTPTHAHTHKCRICTLVSPFTCKWSPCSSPSGTKSL